MNRFELLHGDCLEKIKGLEDNSVDAVVTDPPAGIAFMGRDWDTDKGGRREWIAWLSEVMAECLRVLKPGGHAFVWALPRTSHWTASALEDAGFEIRDCVVHLFGSGFPKSHNVEKATNSDQWQGFGTALKPASEHWWLCRKPLIGTVAANVLAHGTGAINVDGCRVATTDTVSNHSRRAEAAVSKGIYGNSAAQSTHQTDGQQLGRWPPNVVFSHLPECGDTCAEGCAVAELDGQSGTLKSGRLGIGHGSGNAFGVGNTDKKPRAISKEYGNDTGGASRFFPAFRYQAKPARAERDQGLSGFVVQRAGGMTATVNGSMKTGSGNDRETSRANIHPTVKPVELMRWLVRLVTPPGGIVLDPFTGSGTTGVACLLEGFRFIGCEREAEYLAIAKARIEHALRSETIKQPGLFDL